jgi:hypothetical protein
MSVTIDRGRLAQHDQPWRRYASGARHTPSFVVFAADEVTLLIEMVIDLGVN